VDKSKKQLNAREKNRESTISTQLFTKTKQFYLSFSYVKLLLFLFVLPNTIAQKNFIIHNYTTTIFLEYYSKY
jgi:hypothetical protein